MSKANTGTVSFLARTISFLALGAAMAGAAYGADSLLLHRWSFNNDFTDSVGGQTATATNSSFVAVGDGYAIKTAGGTYGTSYASLGTNILPNDGSGFTLELWARLDTYVATSPRVFNIGKNAADNWFCQTWGNENAAGGDFLGIRSTSSDYTQASDTLAPFFTGTFYHLAYVFTPCADNRWLVRGYKHNASTGEKMAAASFYAPSGWKPETLVQTYCWLAGSFSSSVKDAAASFDEVRVWKRALSERELAASAAAGPDATIADGDSPFGKTVYDTATGQVSLASGQAFADGFDKFSAQALHLTGDNSSSAEITAYDGAVAQSGGALSATAAPVVLGEGRYGAAALAATDGAELDVRGVAGNGRGEVVLDDATLRLQGDAATPTLVHRWSFNGDLSDSVGGQTATWKNASFTDCGSGLAVKLAGSASGDSYVDLGAYALPTNGTGATIELWARNNVIVSFSRVFDFGNAYDHSAMLCWSYNTVNTDYAIVRYAPQPQALTQHELSPYTIGTMYHIAATYVPNGDGTWTVRAYKQDAATGATLKETTFTTPSGWSLANLVQTHCYLGKSFDNAASAQATYDEVRIWNGVLTEAQLSANAVAGPDAIGGGEVKSGAAKVGGLASVAVGSGGATIDTNGKDVILDAPLRSLSDGLVHRWSFNGDLADSVGGQNATAANGTFVDLGEGKAVKVAAANTSYVDLGAYALPTNGTGATVELWVRLDAKNKWSRIFDFGNSETNSALLCWHNDTDYTIVRNGKSGSDAIQTLSSGQLGALTAGTEYHIAVTFMRYPDSSWNVRASKRDIATGRNETVSTLTPPSGWTIGKIIQTHCYLGRGFDNTSSATTFDEVRIYDRALSEAELIASAVAGPDADFGGALVKAGAGTLALCGTNTLARPLRVEAGALKAAIGEALSTNSVVYLCAGTVLDLGGNSATAGGLTGGGATVSNGTLAVAGTICPTGEIVLDGVDVSGTLEVTAGSGALRRTNGAMALSGIVLDVQSVSPDGQIIVESSDGFTGDFADVTILPKFLEIRKTATSVRAVKRGLCVIVR